MSNPRSGVSTRFSASAESTKHASSPPAPNLSMEASIRSSHQFRAGRSGVALVITLITLSILVALLVAFVSSMSLERQAAHSYEETQRAKLVAQGAVSHAIDLLRTNIPEPALLSETTAAAPAENWVINPGRLAI